MQLKKCPPLTKKSFPRYLKRTWKNKVPLPPLDRDKFSQFLKRFWNNSRDGAPLTYQCTTCSLSLSWESALIIGLVSFAYLYIGFKAATTFNSINFFMKLRIFFDPIVQLSQIEWSNIEGSVNIDYFFSWWYFAKVLTHHNKQVNKKYTAAVLL